MNCKKRKIGRERNQQNKLINEKVIKKKTCQGMKGGGRRDVQK